LWPKKLFPQVQAVGPLTVEAVADIHRKLAHALVVA
jgi:hypothetical protein